jgi:hypothetical protein
LSANALEKAGAEATAIIERAQATAIVLQAQAMATTLVRDAAEPDSATRVVPAIDLAPRATSTSQAAGPASTLQSATPVTPITEIVQVTGVGFAADGALLNIQFRAPAAVSERWWQGSAYLVDEATGATYREVPVMPKIGPLMSKPKIAGQIGYIMLVNGPAPLKAGALVTVVLGDYRFEHLQIH